MSLIVKTDVIVFYINKNVSEIGLIFFYSRLLLGVDFAEKRQWLSVVYRL